MQISITTDNKSVAHAMIDLVEWLEDKDFRGHALAESFHFLLDHLATELANWSIEEETGTGAQYGLFRDRGAEEWLPVVKKMKEISLRLDTLIAEYEQRYAST